MGDGGNRGGGKSEREAQKESFEGIQGGPGIEGGYDSTVSAERSAQKESFAGIQGGKALGGYDSTIGGGGGGIKGARDLTDREKQKAVFAGLESTPTTLEGLKERAAQQQPGFTTLADLEEQNLEAVQTTLGIKIQPTTFDITRTLGKYLAGEEYGVPADAYIAGTPEQRADLADALEKGQVRATSPTAAAPTEESPVGLYGDFLGAVGSVFSFVASPPTTVIGAITGFPTAPFKLAKDLVDIEQLREAGYVTAKDSLCASLPESGVES